MLLKRFLLGLAVALLLGGAGLAFALRHVENVRKQQALEASKLKREDISITFREGLRREEMAQLLEEKEICLALDFLALTRDKEGTLFPDTYRFFSKTPAADVVASIERNYVRKIGPLNPTPNQLTLASIVEREAQNDSERALIAGIYSNRLQIDMKLDADPTVQYGRDNQQYRPGKDFSFWKPITQANYSDIISPYNTYLNKGLPPGPIANPGKQSIIAAQNPTKTDAVYFLHKNGKLLTSKTFAEHLRNQE